MAVIPRSEFPRPDFERDNWLCLNGEWDFSIGDQSYRRTILVPFACESEMSGVGERGFHASVFYRREVVIPQRMLDKRIFLHFGAVDYQCRVTVNHQFIGEHEGGQTPFAFDITDAIVQGKAEIELAVQDDPFDLEMPRGKQFWEEEPRSIFYDRTTGVWQSVWLEAVDALHLLSCHITPLYDDHAVCFDFELSRAEPCTVEARVRFQQSEAACVRVDARGRSGSFTISFDQNCLQQWNFNECMSWTPENPNLFEVELRVLARGEARDRVRSYFGMRKVSIHNGVFMLNNRPYYQRLVLDQGYWERSLMTAPDDAAYQKDIELIKQMGFNGVRMHQKVEDPRFLYHADRMGLLVWGEMGAAYLYSRKAASRMYAEWQSAVERDYNHPCIVVWVPLNESWGVPEIATSAMQQSHCNALNHMIKSLDITRLIVNNDGWEHTGGDLATVHDYTSQPEKLAAHFQSRDSIARLYPSGRAFFANGYHWTNEPVIVSEYGGVKYTGQSTDADAWGYCEAKDARQWLDKLRRLTRAVQGSKEVQGYCYTQFTDVGTEKNGLLTLGREPKAAIAEIRGINQENG